MLVLINGVLSDGCSDYHYQRITFHIGYINMAFLLYVVSEAC